MSAKGRGRWILGACLALGFVVASLADDAVYRAIDPDLASRGRLDETWWYLALRHCGTLLTWLVLGIVVLSVDRLRRRPADQPGDLPLRGPYIAVAAGTAGLAAELAKLVIGRERPATIQTLESGVEALVYQGYHFRGLFSGFADGSNLGLPSSHAATAAGGAFALAMVWPKLWPLALGVSVGCGVSRLLTGAHFASDVYAGIVLGWLIAFWFGKGLLKPRPRPAASGPALGESPE
ncbi:MAG: phosphatase PAP2 family protein [Phycisphaerales bacterium JB054]